MRNFYFLVLAAWIGGITGCNEIVSTPSERAVAIDVVGDPSDPTPDSMRPADFVGSERTVLDGAAEVAELESTPAAMSPATEESNEPEAEPAPDVIGGQGIAKPVSLKKQRPAATLERK